MDIREIEDIIEFCIRIILLFQEQKTADVLPNMTSQIVTEIPEARYNQYIS